MDHAEGSVSDEYWKSTDNVVIYLSNTSPYLIFSILVSFFAVFAVCFYHRKSSGFTEDPRITRKPDIEVEDDTDEELETKTANLKENVDSLHKLTDTLITEKFVHKDFVESADENCRQVSPEDVPGGDGYFRQQKDKNSKELSKSDEEVDESNTPPNPLSRFKKARQAAILEKVTSDMSEEQLKEEKEAEASQIAAIWDLLNQQKEQFNIGTEQELQDQLHLYCL